MVVTRLKSVRLLAAITLIAASFVMLTGGVARADNTSPPFIACADYNNMSSATVGNGCESLNDTLNNAINFGNRYATTVSLTLLPGEYCPFTIPTSVSRGITIIGAGAAGLASPTDSYSSYEAELTSIEWNPACTGSAPAYDLAVADHGTFGFGTMVLENIALQAAAGGPANGLYVVNAGLTMNDDEVKGFTSGTGIVTQTSPVYGSVGIDNSAVVHNGDGINFAGNGSVIDSTLADNSGTGVSMNGAVSLYNDTITHDGTGVNASLLGGSQVLNTLIGANTSDCVGTSTGSSGWEFEFNAHGAGSGSTNNLYGSSCSPSGGNTNDTTFGSSPTISDLADNGGPTPSIDPPAAALGGAEIGPCDVGGSDQREYRITAVDASCDIGAVDTHATATPALESGTFAFGDIPVNQSGTQNTSVDNLDGGDLVAIASATATGSGVSVAGDGCRLYVLIHSEGSYCLETAQVTPTGVGPISGDIVVHATSGDFDIPVSATGVAALAAPTSVTAAPTTSGSVSLSFTGLSNPSVPVTSYDVRQSSDGGATWTFADYATDGSGNPTSVDDLTNGTSYQFEVAAFDSWGDGPWSSPSAAVTPRPAADTSSLRASTAVTINSGSSTTLSTALSDSKTGKPIVGATVTLLAVSTDAGVTATTNAAGTAKVTVHPSANTLYRWQYAGTTTHKLATSPTCLVSVAQKVTASISAKKVKHGKSVEIYGTVSPSEKGKTVVVQELVHGAWKSLPHPATIKSQMLPGSHGKILGFVYSYKPAKKGKETLRVSRAATSKNAAGLSKTLLLTVT